MICKLGHVEEIRNLPATASAVRPWIYNMLYILDDQYGAERDIDEDDGGYVLYADRGTSLEELQLWFDYERKLCESIEQRGDWCALLYLLNNEYSVTLLQHTQDLPESLRKELEA